jgi:glycosyltransferase involved in cell wall biosynthesis
MPDNSEASLWSSEGPAPGAILPARHIVLYVPDLSAGGAERAALNLLEALPGVDLRVTLLLNRRRGPLCAALPEGAEVRSLDAHRTIAALPKLAAFLRREKPDVLFSYLDFNNVVAIWANGIAGRPTKIIASQHSMTPAGGLRGWKHRLVPLLYRLALPWADHVVAVSDGIAAELSRRYKGRPTLSVIGNPIVTPRYRVLAATPLDHPWFAEGEAPVILGVGRFVAEKNFSLLVDAFAQVARSGPARLVLLGEGPLREALLGQIARYGLNERAAILPVDPNPWRYMSRAKVLVLTSRSEGFGNVLVEAMAVGTPVVSVDCPEGPAEILGHGKWGRLIPQGDDRVLAIAIQETLRHPGDPLARQLRAMEFSAQSIALRYRELIARVDSAERNRAREPALAIGRPGR